jgi:2-polyprenyl-6-methoxyphenol hydroxylase-like FAD-dependent oxidoreductase
MGRFVGGRIFVLLDRGDYWQCAFLIAKGSIDQTRRAGLSALRQSIAELMPAFADRVDELRDWEQIKLLTVVVDRLERWHRPGLLCIGDAAHAMSPIGGVGINLAVQDAVAAANILWQPLATRTLKETELEAVQRRRELPTRIVQGIQLFLQKHVIGRVLGAGQSLEPPLALQLLARFAPLRRLPARMIGMGVRPEHVRTPEVRRQESVTRSQRGA